MAITLTSEEITLLEQLAEAGDRGRTISGAKPRFGVQRLVDVGCVTDHAVSLDTVLYLITESGRQALADAKHKT